MITLMVVAMVFMVKTLMMEHIVILLMGAIEHLNSGEEALAGHPDYAHLLTDLNGNTLDLYDQDGKLKYLWPRLMQMHKSGRHGFQLFENGMVMAGGYAGYGLWGNGTTWDLNAAAMGVVFFDDSGARLTGANHPKIKMMEFSNAHNFSWR